MHESNVDDILIHTAGISGNVGNKMTGLLYIYTVSFARKFGIESSHFNEFMKPSCFTKKPLKRDLCETINNAKIIWLQKTELQKYCLKRRYRYDIVTMWKKLSIIGDFVLPFAI